MAPQISQIMVPDLLPDNPNLEEEEDHNMVPAANLIPALTFANPEWLPEVLTEMLKTDATNVMN